MLIPASSSRALCRTGRRTASAQRSATAIFRTIFARRKPIPTNPNCSDVISDYESVLEVNYIAQICPGISIVPDFQYIWNPGGRISSDADPSKPIPDAAVFGVRTNISY